MNIRQLECFLAAVDEGSLTRAARRLGLAQPSLSAHIQALDRAQQAVRASVAVEEGELEVATVLSMAVGLLPPAIVAWQARHPNVAIRLQEFVHRRLLEGAVEGGGPDIAV